MRILVMSDSHGHSDAVKRALDAEQRAQAVIHLGDGAAEARRLAARESRPWYIVRGNCDVMYDVPLSLTVTLGGKRLYLTHGAEEHVKSSLLTLSLAAEEQEADAALYGHTHHPATDFRGGILLFNPGSVGGNGSYGVLEIGQSGIHSQLLRL